MAKINEKQKWPTDKVKYDKGYLRLFGKICPLCNGKPRGILSKYGEGWTTCPRCNGIGYVERKDESSIKKV